MTWAWESLEEFTETVQPSVLRPRGLLRLSLHSTAFENLAALVSHAQEIRACLDQFNRLGFSGTNEREENEVPEAAQGLVLQLVDHGERLLAYHRRLAKSESAYGFLSSSDIFTHWAHYKSFGLLHRAINELVRGASELLEGYQGFIKADNEFLTRNPDLPQDLAADFKLSRDLFSVGLDEVAVLIAGRGLETVLRSAASKRRLKLLVKGDSVPLADSDTYDIVEALYRIRWKTTDDRVLPGETRALLHYLRAVRNTGAHGGRTKKSNPSNPREIATVFASTAARLWKDVTGSRKQFLTTEVRKTW